MGSRTRKPFRAVLAALTVTVWAAGCTTSVPRNAVGAPVLSVATGLWPLAQAAREIGGEKVAVDDVVPAGTNPLTFDPGTPGTRTLQSAGLVLLAGGGLQPGVARASQGARRVVDLASQLGAANPFVWLEPETMGRAVQTIEEAMAAANPAAARLYERNAEGLRAEIASLGIDYSSTLSSCRASTMITPDGAFATMAARYGLTDIVAPPGVDASASTPLATKTRGAGFTEPWVDDAGVEAVAAATGTKTHPVDTLVGAAPGGTSAPGPYLDRMEQVLAVLSGALGCTSVEQ